MPAPQACVSRIGHGVLLRDDPILLEYNRRQRIPMVMNLASNWQLNAIEDDQFQNHPFLDKIRLGIPIALSTDDEGMFHTDIAHECVLAVQNTDIQYSELKQISYSSVEALFAEESLKSRLLEKLDAKFEAFETKMLQEDGTAHQSGANEGKTWLWTFLGALATLLFQVKLL